jgi:exopolysaccharide biosynthesis protein
MWRGVFAANAAVIKGSGWRSSAIRAVGLVIARGVSVQPRQQCESNDCERTADVQQKRLVVAHSPPDLCRASAVALSAMMRTIVAAAAG